MERRKQNFKLVGLGFGGIGTMPGGTQGIILALCSGVTPGNTSGTTYVWGWYQGLKQSW